MRNHEGNPRAIYSLARKLESELDVKVAAYGKLCAGFESSYAKGESGLAQDQLLQTRSSEIEKLLARLSDVNDAMRSALSGTADSRSHTLARHRDILHDFTQEFRRLTTIIGAARDRADLMGAGQSSPLLGSQSGTGLLLRERGMLATSNAALDDVIGQAQGVSSNLQQQRHLFDSIGGKMSNLGARFPVVNSLLNAIRRKKSKDTVILSVVVAVCTLFILIYWWNK
ncbi:hypothetical protein N2152v2_001582 [Parachlorella kessleri]